ncbi:hypothetical protein [Wolbachia endosymbiont (group B) of Villa cingulata]|uniref:hypothetical protein n=1 Tax=Wolbachia endosymbiont (group B) of Villa cingulata TaxID=3066157 RepID=UPI00333F810F
MLKNNANINAVSDGCLVPYSYVTTMSSKTEIKEMIYHCTSSTTSQVMQGFTALHLAFFYCRLDIANLLLNNNIINVIIRNANGKTAFEVIPGYESLCSDGCDMSKIYLDLSKFHKNNCTELLLSARINTKLELEAGDTPDPAPSSAVKPFSFINSIFNWVTTATLNGLFSSAPTLLPAQQSVDHLAGSPIGSSQVDFNATALLVDVVVKKFTGKKYSRLLDNPPLTRLSIIEKKLETAISSCEKLYQCPESSLSNLTISKGMHQKSL